MKIEVGSPTSLEATILMDELSDILESLTGNSGRDSFNIDDVSSPKGLFVIAYNDKDEPVGCGSIRQISEDIAEVKRMYAKYGGVGIGTNILSYLEKQANILGYSEIWLATRTRNQGAVLFYEKQGYKKIENYGRYINNNDAVCFGKVIK